MKDGEEAVRAARARIARSLRDGACDETTGALAERVMRERTQAVRALAHGACAGGEALHVLRVEIKRARYALEALTPVLPADECTSLLAMLALAQDRLGEVNDLVTLVARLERYAAALAGGLPGEAGSAEPGLEDDVGDLLERFRELRDARQARAAEWWVREGAAAWGVEGTDELGERQGAADMRMAPAAGNGKNVGSGTAAVHSSPKGAESAQGELWLAGKRFAVIDIGSNSLRLLAVELIDSRSWNVLAEERSMTRLAMGLAAKGELCTEAMARSVEAIERFRSVAKRLGVERVRAFATAAVREAKNRDQFIRLVRERAGLELELVSARDEGKLTHLSVARVHDLSAGTATVIDIGGGSLEVVQSQQGVITGNTSMPLGAVRVTEAFGGAGAVAGKRFREVRRYAQRTIERRVRKPDLPPNMLVGCGGACTTILTLAAAARGVVLDRSSPALVQQAPVQRSELKDILRRLRKMPLEKRMSVPGLPSDRADIIIAGMVVIERLMKHLGSEQLTVHPGGFREGLLLRMIEDEASTREGGGAASVGPMDEVRDFARRCRYEEAHSEHVADLALSLFDQFQRESDLIADLGAGGRERLMLEAAAVLHDVGITVSYDGHHRHSYTMIRHADLQGLSAREIELVALIARFHRKRGPSASHRALRQLAPDDSAVVRRLAGILRVADGLDRSHSQHVTGVHVRFGSRGVHLEVTASTEAKSDVKAARRKADLLEAMIGGKVAIGEAGAELSTERD